MPIAESDILYKYSSTTGPGNSTAGAQATSLGEFISTTEITTAVLNNWFDDVSGDENAALDVEYRCIFVHNSHGTLTLTAPMVWLSAEVAGGANIAIAIDTLAASALASASAQADEVVDESTAPDAVGAFSSPTTKATGLALGDLAPGNVRAVWFRRTATDSAALDDDSATIRIEGDTAE